MESKLGDKVRLRADFHVGYATKMLKGFDQVWDGSVWLGKEEGGDHPHKRLFYMF